MNKRRKVSASIGFKKYFLSWFILVVVFLITSYFSIGKFWSYIAWIIGFFVAALYGSLKKVEFDEENSDEFTVSTTDGGRRNFRVSVSSQTMMFTSWYIPENKSNDYELVNSINRKFLWVKTTIDADGDFAFYMYLPPAYERRSFGSKVDLYLDIIRDSIEMISP